jgi:hypothetical protein
MIKTALRVGVELFVGHRVRGKLFTAGIVAMALVVFAATPAPAITKAQLKAKALSLSNLPTGWSVDNSSNNSSGPTSGCLAGLKRIGHGTKVTVSFENGQLPVLEELLANGRGELAAYNQLNHILAGCKHFTSTSNGQSVTYTVGAMSFPSVGSHSSAYSVAFSVQGVNAGFDIVLFQFGSIVGAIAYGDIGQPDPASVQAYVTEAVNKLEGKPTVTPTRF